MPYRAIVTDAARALDLVDGNGELVPLDSLALLDLVESLEQSTKVFIPTSSLREGHFASIESIASFLVELAQNEEATGT